MRKFSLSPGYLGFEARNLRCRRADIGGSEGRIEGGQELAALDPFAFLRLEALSARLATNYAAVPARSGTSPWVGLDWRC
jgi:hypothetical protein